MNTICEIRITGNRHVIDEKLASLKKKKTKQEKLSKLIPSKISTKCKGLSVACNKGNAF